MGIFDGESIYGSSATPYSDAENYIQKGVNTISYDIEKPYGLKPSIPAKQNTIIEMKDFYQKHLEQNPTVNQMYAPLKKIA